MRKRQCNRCDGKYRPMRTDAGQLELKYGLTEIDADLCPDCYGEMVDSFNGGFEEDE